MGIGGDPFWASVTLLMKAAAGGIADLSLIGSTVTANNGAAVSATQSQFSGSSFSFLNAGANNGFFTLSSNAWMNLGNAAWTLEMWAYLTGTGQADLLCGRSTASTTNPSVATTAAAKLTFNQMATATLVTSAASIPLNQFNHLAITHDGAGGTLRLFINGTLDANTATTSIVFVGDNTGHIGFNNNAQAISQAYVDQVRVTLGVCRYTASFTAPTAPFPATFGIPPFRPTRTYLRR